MKIYKLVLLFFFATNVVCCFAQKLNGNKNCISDIDSLYSTHINAFIDSLDRQKALNRHVVFVINFVDQNLEKCKLNFSISYIYNKSEFFEVNPIGYYKWNEYYVIIKSKNSELINKVKSFHSFNDNSDRIIIGVLCDDDDPFNSVLYSSTYRVVGFNNGITKASDFDNENRIDPDYRIIHYNFDSNDFIIRKIHPDSISEKIPY